MATYKNISNDWYITVDSGTGTIYIDGNLDVTGNITYVSDIAVNDAFLIVAANNTGTVQDMGLVATKVANSSYAGLRFDVSANAWQISSSVYGNGAPISPYQSITSGNTGVPGGNIYDVQVNNGSGSFAANGNLQYNPSTSKLTLNGVQVLSNIGTAPTAVANSVSIYNNAPGSGQTGLYVTGNTIATDEVMSLTRAKLYSIIF
jgi:flagellar basal body rod protein FlgF